jgi:SAM-dependent MidA family methyltransferase
VRPFEAGLRREPPPSIDVGSEPELVDRIRAEIAADGPITFARFMERALYEPGLGYYRSAAARPGLGGDFLTAPETHPVFGRALARQLDELWRILGRPDAFVLREHGAGGGTLAVAILDGLRREGSALLQGLRYEAVEVEGAREVEIGSRLAEAGFGDVLRRPAGEPAAEPIVGCIVANEVADALPVHGVTRRDGRLWEIHVDWQNEAFTEILGEPSTPALAARLDAEGVELAEGQRAEISLAIDGWIEAVAGGLRRGLILIIDYGYPAAELYGPRRAAGTMLAYLNHRAHDDVLANVGRQDLTAHVDLTAIERAAARAGLVSVGVTSQAEFLAGLGITELVAEAQRDPATTLQSYLALRSGVMRLLDPAASGGFKVLGFGRGLPVATQLRGFGWRLRPPLPDRPETTPD